jgi:hypothetical protein
MSAKELATRRHTNVKKQMALDDIIIIIIIARLRSVGVGLVVDKKRAGHF